MTPGSEWACRHPDSPFAISGKCLISAPRHSGAGRNPVVYITHSRSAGMTTDTTTQRAIRQNLSTLHLPVRPPRPSVPDLPAAGRRGSTTSAACSRRRSTTYIPVGVHPCRRASVQAWIPAFAGMTPGSEWACRHPDSPFAISGKCLISAPRHSGAGRNPVVYIVHSRTAGMTTDMTT